MHRLSGDSLRRLLEAAGYQIPSYVTPIEAYLEGSAAYYRFDVNGRTEELYEADLGRMLPLNEPPRPDPMLDRELAALTPRRDPLAETWREAVPAWGVRFLRRQEERKRLSWLLPEQVSDGAGLGLSNGPYRAATAPEAILQDSRAYLHAEFEYRPGTLKLKVAGKLTPTRRKATRGEIRRITPASGRRLLLFVREVDHLGYTPDVLVTTTYPADWMGPLGMDKPFMAKYRQGLAELERWTKLMAEVKKKAARDGWHPRFDPIYEAYRAAVERVRRLADEFFRKLPDGRIVKRHLAAFLKRFDRRFGRKVLAILPDREAAEALAEHLREKHDYPEVKVLKHKKGGFEVVAVLYRALWWMEFQRRGAPHLHFLFFDTHEIDWDEVRRWAGPAWAGVVHGLRNLNPYLSAEVGQAYDTLRTLWGKEAGEAFFAEWLEARGLSYEVWKHLRAGTRVERMEKPGWGYAAKEVSGGKAKAYQRRVPKTFRNIGRWWGYRNYKRVKPTTIRLPMADPKAREALMQSIAVAETHMPKPAFKFKQKLERARKAIENGEPYAYLTIWGWAGTHALRAVEEALSA